MNELLEALKVLNKYGLTVVDDKGKQVNKPRRKRPNKRPNGSGSIVKLSGTRRKPYGVYVTVGYDEQDGHQIQKALGYFETREKAQECLDHWNFSKTKNKTNIRIPTFSQIFDKIFEEEVSSKSYSTRSGCKESGFKPVIFKSPRQSAAHKRQDAEDQSPSGEGIFFA